MGKFLGAVLGFVFLIGGLIFLLVGPKGCERDIAVWKASAYGTNYLVVHTTFKATRCWVLPNGSVTSESSSDGIYFKDSAGNVVHVAGSYVYVQIKTNPNESLQESYQRALKKLRVTVPCN